ncbi:Reverse transcriptase (RNA-dependent DNA polymerase) [Ruminobacter amylophilus]|uniref:Reverse transcriptase (RNA-dependent DNA polymerase) n=1 Tax=Ruminobacter amylophilus TaxID=867 RepID=A0A662ZED9_9GAMM|nr:reverse transcriptase domain-containing protein [Ruminobacter amylophilus]SFP03556.1 Reverse transcriptase (RNA-dependent DNA polymerase) [Ruminobacter amylophilus]
MKNNKKKNKNNKKVTKTDNDFVSDFSVNLHALSRFMKNLPKDARLKEMAGGRNVIEVKKILENNALNEMLISNQQLICDHLRDEAEVYHEIQNLIAEYERELKSLEEEFDDSESEETPVSASDSEKSENGAGGKHKRRFSQKHVPDEATLKLQALIAEKLPYYREKNTAHFDSRISFSSEDDVIRMHDWINNPEEIARHSFYPLISNTQKTRQKRKIEEFRFYSKALKENTDPEIVKECREKIEKFKKNGPVKERPIRICSHLDSLIYARYARLLRKKYEEYIRDLGFSDSVLAYRKTPVRKINGVKVEFPTIGAVYDVVRFIREKNCRCIALSVDLSSFFDCIDHRNLKEEWQNILGVAELPPDHYNVFKSLTNYCYVEKSELERYACECHADEIPDDEDEDDEVVYTSFSWRRFFRNGADFRKFRKWYKAQPDFAGFSSFHRNPGIVKGGRGCGVPQGLSISAVLSNIYMIKFDKAMADFARENGCMYRRYCDDILLIGPDDRNFMDSAYEFLCEKIRERGEGLKLHPYHRNFRNPYSKCQMYDFTSPQIREMPMQYLGFYFNGERVRIRESSIAGFYRDMSKAVTALRIRKFNFARKKIMDDIGYLAAENLGKVKLVCVRHVMEDKLSKEVKKVIRRCTPEAARRVTNRCLDISSRIDDFAESDQFKDKLLRFIISDVDKKTGRTVYRQAFVPNLRLLHRIYSFRSTRNFMRYVINAAEVFDEPEKGNDTIRRQLRSHTTHLNRKIRRAYLINCEKLKEYASEFLLAQNR